MKLVFIVPAPLITERTWFIPRLAVAEAVVG